ncbi:hypothetical protein LQZ19_12135 [Treponema primitia]|uniref:hypothetical protein n=1 Tax=Treponema primitia TaxID=88058 RepID=UPI003980F2E3
MAIDIKNVHNFSELSGLALENRAARGLITVRETGAGPFFLYALVLNITAVVILFCL